MIVMQPKITTAALDTLISNKNGLLKELIAALDELELID